MAGERSSRLGKFFSRRLSKPLLLATCLTLAVPACFAAPQSGPPPLPTPEVLALIDQSHRAGSPAERLDLLGKALTRAEAIKDRAGEALTLYWQGVSESDLRKYAEAVQKYEAALTINRTLGDKIGEHAVLTNESDAFLSQNNFKKAFDCLLGASTLEMLPALQENRIYTLGRLGMLCRNMNRLQESIQNFSQAIQLGSESRDPKLLNVLANSYDDLGVDYRMLQQTGLALDAFNKSITVWRQLKDERREAQTSEDLAAVYADLGDENKADESYESAAILFEKENDFDGEIQAVQREAQIRSRFGHFNDAYDAMSRAIKIAGRGKNLKSVADAQTAMGRFLLEAGQTSAALYYLEPALTTRTDHKDLLGRADSLDAIGEANEQYQNWKTAATNYREVLQIRQAFKDVSGQALAFERLASAADGAGDRKSALSLLKQALALQDESTDPIGRSFTLRQMGEFYLHEDNPLALSCLDKALTIQKRFRDLRAQASTCASISQVYLDQRDDRQAIIFAEAALGLNNNAQDVLGRPATLEILGRAYDQAGKTQEAIDSFQKGLDILIDVSTIGDEYAKEFPRQKRGLERNQAEEKFFETDGDLDKQSPVEGFQHTQIRVMDEVCTIYESNGQLQLAIENAKSAIRFERRAKDREDLGKTLYNLANMYRDLGEDKNSLAAFQEALTLQVAAKDLRSEAATRLGIAEAFRDQNNMAEAKKWFEQAFQVATLSKERVTQFAILLAEGEAFCDQGDLSTGKRLLDDASNRAQSLNDPYAKTLVSGVLGEVFIKAGKDQEGLDQLAEVLPIVKARKDSPMEASILAKMGEACHGLGWQNQAIAFAKQSVNLTQTMRSNIIGLDQEAQRSYRKSVSWLYRELADWLAERGQIIEAEHVLDLLKDEEYFNYLRTSTEDPNQKVDLTPRESAWVARYEALDSKLSQLATERESLLQIDPPARTPAQKSRLEALRLTVNEAAKTFQTFLSESQDAFNKAKAETTRVDELRGSEELQRALSDLPNHPAAIYTLATQDGVRVIVSIPGLSVVRQSKQQIKYADLLKKVSDFRAALTNPHFDPRPLGAELYDLLIRPIEKDLTGAGAQTLMWSLDGPLRYVPVWALYDRENKKFLIEKFPSSVFTPRTIDRLTAQPRPWSGAEFGISKAENTASDQFGPLPEVDQELATVHAMLGGPQPLMDDAFTSKSLYDAIEDGNRVIHVATHFKFRPGNDVDSYLLLGQGKTLSVEELKNLGDNYLKNVDLLVLSACETAISDSADGSEFEGFSLLAQLKGAGAVIATLWPVADNSTAILMGEFYRLKKSHPEWTKLEALRQAQLEMLHGELQSSSAVETPVRGIDQDGDVKGLKRWSGPRYSHPFYWAPFVLTGNWK